MLFDLSARGVTLLVTTHYMDEAERCTDVGYLYLSKLLVLGKPDDLKRLPDVTPQGMRRYELRTPAPAQRLSVLRGDEGVRDATLFGESIHLLLAREVSPQELLERTGTPLEQSEIREIAPTLEDVFVTLTNAAEQRRAREEAAPSAEPSTEPPDGRGGEVESASSRAAPLARPPLARSPNAAPGQRSTRGFPAVLIKEFLHIRRQRSTLFFMLVVPVMQTLIFGYAIDTQIDNLPTVVYDLDGRRASRELAEALVNTRKFKIIRRVHDEPSFRRELTSGRATVGVRIPPRYSDRLLRGEQVQVQVLIDGSDSQAASTALSSANLLGLNLSIRLARVKGESLNVGPARDPAGRPTLPIEMRPRLLYNPNLENAHFFVPGLVGIILQLVTLFLTSFAVVRERELGTLEQLFVTPVGRAALLLGKLTPYAVVGFIETLIVLAVMVYVFGVAIRGELALLVALASLFLVCGLGLGLLVSTLAKTQVEALQFAFMIMLPSVLLSGFMFPREEMPWPIYLVTFAIPVTYFIEILRGIVLARADFLDLSFWVGGLTVCCLVVLILSVVRFRKQLA